MSKGCVASIDIGERTIHGYGTIAPPLPQLLDLVPSREARSDGWDLVPKGGVSLFRLGTCVEPRRTYFVVRFGDALYFLERDDSGRNNSNPVVLVSEGEIPDALRDNTNRVKFG